LQNRPSRKSGKCGRKSKKPKRKRAAYGRTDPRQYHHDPEDGQIIVAELFFNHSSTETCRDKLLKLVLADRSRLSASDGQEPGKRPKNAPIA